MANSTTNCINRIYCTSTKQSYIGQTVDANRRWAEHIKDLRTGKHHSHKLQEAFWKHGEINLRFEVIETDLEVDDLTNREAYWMKEYKGFGHGFNIQYVGHPNGKPIIPYSSRRIIPPPPLTIIEDDKPKPFGSAPNNPPSKSHAESMREISTIISDALTELKTRQDVAEEEARRLRTENEILIRENAVLRWRLGERNDDNISVA